MPGKATGAKTVGGKSARHVVAGRLGGSAPKTKPSGFKAHPELAVAAGRLGGKNRWKAKHKQDILARLVDRADRETREKL